MHDLWPDDLSGVIVEITEQEVADPDDLKGTSSCCASVARRSRSTTSAPATPGLLRLAQMAPDYVKVDRQVVTGVAGDPIRAAVLEALVTLSHRLGATVIGEGVESFADLAALGDHDVDLAQGSPSGVPRARSRSRRTSSPPAAPIAVACSAGRGRAPARSRAPGTCTR